MKSIAVFCASSIGKRAVYKNVAFEVGQHIAHTGADVVYGGSRIGLMGAVADGALQAGGKVYGVLPKFMMSRELAHQGLTELILVESMQERKLKMHELSDAVLALPGGFGTFEELFEMLTWGQLGLHRKPIGVLNVEGYYDHLSQLLSHMIGEGLLKENTARMLMMSGNINELFQSMNAYKPIRPSIRMKPDEA